MLYKSEDIALISKRHIHFFAFNGRKQFLKSWIPCCPSADDPERIRVIKTPDYNSGDSLGSFTAVASKHISPHSPNNEPTMQTPSDIFFMLVSG